LEGKTAMSRLATSILILGVISCSARADDVTPPKKHLLIYRTEQGARTSCPNDQIVWASTSSHALYVPGNAHYGHTHGGCACESVARAKGYHGPTAHS
jgi:hypothetical protein